MSQLSYQSQHQQFTFSQKCHMILISILHTCYTSLQQINNNRCLVANLTNYQLKDAYSSFQDILSPTYYSGSLQSYYLNNRSLQKSNISPLTLQLFFNSGPFILLFLVLVSLMIPAIGCCWCPLLCPSKYCKKNQKEMYVQNQIYCPFISYYVLVPLVIGSSMASAILRENLYKKGSADFQCKLASYLNSYSFGANGTFKNASTFFSGFQPLKQSASFLKTNYSSQLSRFQIAFNQITTINNQLLTAKSNIDSVYSAYTDITYTNAFTDASGSYISISSSFKGLFLGPSTKTSTIMGNLLIGINKYQNTLNQVLNPVTQALNQLSSITSPVSMTSTAQQTLNKLIVQLQRSSNFIESTPLFPPIDIKTLLVLIFSMMLSASLLLAVFTSFGIIFSMRNYCFYIHNLSLKLLYVSVTLMTALSVYLSVQTVISYQHCRMTNQIIQDNYTASFIYQGYGLNYLSQRVSMCTGNQSYQSLAKIDSLYYESLKSFRVLALTSQQFTQMLKGFSATNISNLVSQVETVIDNVKKNLLLDVNSSNALIFLGNLANKSLPAGTCNFNIQYDSWLPNLNLTKFSCPSGIVQRPPCSDISSTGLCPLGCYSFTQTLDTNGIQGDTTPGGDMWLTKLKSRYGANCNYATYVSKIKNYDSSRITNLNSLKASLDTNVLSHITNAANALNSLNSTLLSFNQNYLTLSKYYNKNFGAVVGLQCFAMNSTLTQTKNSICFGWFSGTYVLFILVGVNSFLGGLSLLLVMMGTVRQRLQRQKKIARVNDDTKFEVQVYEGGFSMDEFKLR